MALKRHNNFLKSKLIKIDTDGFDCEILIGSLDLLSQIKPVIFFEYGPYYLRKFKSDEFEIFKKLRNIGYKAAIIYNNIGEYLVSIRLKNKEIIEDLNNYFSGRNGSQYCDICVFHKEDFDLFKRIRNLELSFFYKNR